MNKSTGYEYVEELLSHFCNAVKQIQIELVSKEENEVLGASDLPSYIGNDSPAGRILYSCLEMIFSHGLKNKEYGIWEAVKYFCRKEVVQTIQRLEHVVTTKGKGRAWIYLALNEKELEGYLVSFQLDLPHMYRYYHKSAMICGSQLPILQTLISGLDLVTFKLILDVQYLETAIMCGKNWTNTNRRSNSTQERTKIYGGSVVHIDTSSITKTGQKAVGFMKEMLSWENSSERRTSIESINTVALVTVNQNPALFKSKKHCPDCNERSELVCLCVKENAEAMNTSVPSKNMKILVSSLNSGDNDESASETSGNGPSQSASTNVASGCSMPYFKHRFNPFDKNSAEEKASSAFRRFDDEIPILDAPIEVIHKSITRRRKKFSDSASVTSTNSEDICHMRKLSGQSENSKSSKKHGSMGDLHLSDRLIGFDPMVGTLEDLSSQGQKLCQDANVLPSVVNLYEGVTHNPPDTSCNTKGVSSMEKWNMELTQTNKHESVVSCQGSLIASNSLEFSIDIIDGISAAAASRSLQLVLDEPSGMDISKQTTLDGNKNEVGLGPDDVIPIRNEKNQQALCEKTSGDANPERLKSEMNGKDREKGALTKVGSDDSKATDSVNKAEDIPPSAMMHLTPVKTSSDVLNKSEAVRILPISLQEKRSIQKQRGMRRYCSESEQLLNALTLKEVERLRAEIQTKLKPSRDRLEKVQKSIAEKNQISGSFQPDSSFMLCSDNGASETSVNHVFDDSSDDTMEQCGSSSKRSTNLQSGSTSSLPILFLSNKASTPISGDLSGAIMSHRAVADIDNNFKLYLALEILKDEDEEIVKLFHVSTEHAEGNWTALYLLLSNSRLYFMRSGDGNCPYRIEHIVSYEDLDYASVGYNDQTIEFVFYKSRSSKSNKVSRDKVRTKLKVDTADKDLTDFIITILIKSLTVFTKHKQSMVKVCPPVFHGAKEHEISLVKYLRSEGLTGNIQLYQLVHWEDPDFVTAASVTKVSLEGTLRYKAQTFWGSTWRPAYFFLSGGVLYQYTCKDGEKPEASYELTGSNCIGCKRVRSLQSSSPRLEFEIVFRDQTRLELCGYSDVEVTEWLQCLCMIVSLDQASTIDKMSHSDGIVMSMLNHDALVPCSLIIADETLLLCHEDQHTGFCRTLASARRQDIAAVNIDRSKSFVCEIAVEFQSELSRHAKWGVFFPARGPLEAFLAVLNSFSKVPAMVDKSDNSHLAHYLEARTLLDGRWTRSDNLLKGRGGSAENYTFV